MAGCTILDLPRPARRYRVDLHARGFETEANARKEDARRAKSFRKAAATHGGKWGKRALKLADRIDPALNPRIPRTLASARYLRHLRILIIGNLWAYIDRRGVGTVIRADVVKATWQRDVVDLAEESAARIKNEFRATLGRIGTTRAPGILFAGLHGDFERLTLRYRLHFHLALSGGKRGVIQDLRKRRGFSVRKKKRSTADVAQPVLVRKKGITNPAYALTYLFKSYWPEIVPDLRERETSKKPRPFKVRMREPYHSEYLMWLDKQDAKDLIILMGIKPSRSGFIKV